MFEYFYREPTEQCGRRIRRPEFSYDVKVEFIAIATHSRATESAVSDGHLMRVRSDWAIKNTMAVASCSLCILRAPHWTLDCKHRFCRECILSHGTLGVPWRPELLSCPVCRCRNTSPIVVRPPTAGKRTLDLRGTDGENVLHFLRDLRCGIGLSSMAFKEHFDGVVGSDAGALATLVVSVADSLVGRDIFHRYCLSRRLGSRRLRSPPWPPQSRTTSAW